MELFFKDRPAGVIHIVNSFNDDIVYLFIHLLRKLRLSTSHENELAPKKMIKIHIHKYRLRICVIQFTKYVYRVQKKN